MRRQAMTVWTFKTSSDFGNELFFDTALDGSNSLDDIEDSLSSMKLRLGTGSPDTSVTESSNNLWQNMLKEETQELDGINRFGERLTVTVLGEFMESETKLDFFIVGDDFNQAIPTQIIYVCANEVSANRTEQVSQPVLVEARAGSCVATQKKVFSYGHAIREAGLTVLRPTVHGSETSRTQKRSLSGLAASSGVLNPRENKVFSSGQAIREASLTVLRPTVHGSETSRTQKHFLRGLAASSGVLNPQGNKIIQSISIPLLCGIFFHFPRHRVFRFVTAPLF